MFTDFRKVDVWLGSFASEEALEEYLGETYTDEEATPISAFAADQGETFYDHDFVESSFFDGTADVLTQLRGCSFARSYAEAVEARARAVAFGPLNTILLVWGEEISNPRSSEGETYSLHYVGRFDCEPGE
jgi:hypothetical protein